MFLWVILHLFLIYLILFALLLLVMETYMLKSKTQFPIIHRTDVMARWLGLKHGDVVKITRYNETSGEYFYFRCCM